MTVVHTSIYVIIIQILYSYQIIILVHNTVVKTVIMNYLYEQ